MWDKREVTFFRKTLFTWFELNRRDFPWRAENCSNYEIILSEILLQRTQAETVSRYYQTFFSAYPDWDALLEATVADLEKILKPLGLHKHRAKRIFTITSELKTRQGSLPRNRLELQDSCFASLYISNAYELFVLNQRSPLLDVNMSKVLSRFFFPRDFTDVRHDTLMQDLAQNVINVDKCKELNWAILDFSALVCKRRKPKCDACRLNKKCRQYRLQQEKTGSESLEKSTSTLPFKHVSNNQFSARKPLKVVSLFSGCGGMDLGFEGGFIVHHNAINKEVTPEIIDEEVDANHVRLRSTKFQTVFANDILKEARDVWVNNFTVNGYSPGIYHVGSIVDLVALHRQGIVIFPPDVDVVTGGFPCQDFSLAGKRKGFNSRKDHQGAIIQTEIPTTATRGQLYMWLKEVIEITQPKLFIAENVKGLVNLANVKEVIQRDFSTAGKNGYLVLDPVVLQAANYGVPQSRERVIFIGIKKSELNATALRELSKPKINERFNPYPKPTHSYSIEGIQLKKPVQLTTIFDGLPEPELSQDPSQKFYSKAKFMGSHCQGQKEVDLKGIGPTIRSEHHGNIEFRRLSIENGGKLTGEINGKKLKERRLTPRECALIQTFPPDYAFVVPAQGSRFFISPSTAYKLIGNAVPPLLAYHIATRLEDLWALYFSPSVGSRETRVKKKSNE